MGSFSLKNLEKNISHFGLGKEKQYFLENIAVLIDSGMGVYSVLEALKEDMHSPTMKSIIQQMQNGVAQGSSLWRAMKDSGIFSEYVIALVKLGEESGQLSQNLSVLSKQQEKNRSLTSKLRSSLMYPAIVLSLALFLGVFIMVFILPQLTKVFASLRVELPLVTRGMIAIGNFFGEYGLIAGPSIVLTFIVLVYFLFINRSTNAVGQKIVFSLPVVRKVMMYVEMARFSYILGILLQNNISVLQALRSLHQSSRIQMYKKLYAFLYTSISNGDSFIKSFRNYRHVNSLIPSTTQQLIAVGEESGRLADTLLKISVLYEEKSETAAKNLTILLEPLILIVIWLGVLFLALAIIMPIYGLLNGIR